MTHYSNLTTQMELDFEALAVESIELSLEAIDQAAELATQIPNEQRQWQTYLNALALFSFEQWLAERSPEMRVNKEECSLFQPAMANSIEAVFNLKVHGFKLCLIATGSLMDEEVTLPRAVIDLPEFVPHFYVLIDVREEQEMAVIRGFLPYNQLLEKRARVNVTADEDWTYQFPLTWFDGSLDRLLLNLRCLEPSAIPLPAVPDDRLTQLSRMRSQLEALLPQLQSPERQLWQVLSWEQGAVVLTNPELLNWLYQLQTQDEAQPDISLTPYLSDLLQLLTQKAVNVRRWLWNELDELAQEFSWQLLPSFAGANAMRSLTQEVRSPAEEFEGIVRELQHNNVEISTEARGAYRNLQLGETPLRLYALTWLLLSESVPEWTLLLIVGTPSQTSLPVGLKLRLSDQTGVLVEQELDTDENHPYFFTSVVGTQDEKFIATVSLGSGIEQTLPPFSFTLER
ncbi:MULTISPECIES: DUF1822 family protein [unclassified Coleofasciculus]|uniref:DUF1822 family protein n=1 Tax=unclassified Coleofasciculus TaxID=2692782 RepID=UPI00187F873E|nr:MULTISPECIES: DUF1822 family protein [unclassified Coleofasciculus]MBE9126752.1 DUF1822 family protein [Coleofasciculus sp. LEGE 07081]MBE9150123.1 DUF1822 family protein [Coleofasciculus sp. LEGE 07092]